MLTDMQRKMDIEKISFSSEGANPFLLLDSYGSSTKFGYLEHKRVVCLVVLRGEILDPRN